MGALALLALAFASQPAAAGPARSAQAEYELPTPTYLSPFPVVRLAGRVTRTGVRLTLVRVTSPPGSEVTIRCRGRRAGCPFRSRTRTSPPSRRLRFRRLERRLRARALIQVFVRDDDEIGKYTSLRVLRRKFPRRRDACVLPGESRPAECP